MRSRVHALQSEENASGLQLNAAFPASRRNEYGTSQSVFLGPQGNKKIIEYISFSVNSTTKVVYPTAPVISSENIVYIGLGGNNDPDLSSIYAFNGTDGHMIWNYKFVVDDYCEGATYKYKGAVKFAPIITKQNWIIVGIDIYQNCNGVQIAYLCAFNGTDIALHSDNEPFWVAKLGENTIGGSPIVNENGRVYVPVFHSTCYKDGNKDNTKQTGWLSALDVNSSHSFKNGEYAQETYSVSVENDNCDKSTIFYSSTPVISRTGLIYLGSFDFKLHAFQDTGSNIIRRASFSTDGKISSSATLTEDGSDEVIFIGSRDGKLYARSLIGAQFDPLWVSPLNLNLSDCSQSPVYSRQGIVYVHSENENANATLFAIGSKNGTILWSAVLGLSCRNCNNAVVPVIGKDGTVYVGYNRTFFALNGTNGSIVWKRDLKLPRDDVIYSPPALSENGTIYFSTLSGNVLTLRQEGPLVQCEPPLKQADEYSSKTTHVCYYNGSETPTSTPSSSPSSSTHVPTSAPTCGVGSGGAPGSCETCVMGFYSKYGPKGYYCEPCRAGEYNTESGSTNCSSCPYPSASLWEGKSTCDGVCVCLGRFTLVIIFVGMLGSFFLTVLIATKESIDTMIACILLMIVPCLDFVTDVTYILGHPMYNKYLFDSIVFTFIFSNGYFCYYLWKKGKMPSLHFFKYLRENYRFLWLEVKWLTMDGRSEEEVEEDGDEVNNHVWIPHPSARGNRLTFGALDEVHKFLWLLFIWSVSVISQLSTCTLLFVSLLVSILCDVVILSVCLLIGIFCFQTKVVSIRPVRKMWFYVWSGENQNVLDDSEKFVDTKLLNEAIFCEMLLESVPQLILQVLNSALIGSIGILGFLSSSVSFYLVINGVWQYGYVFFNQKEISEFPLDNSLQLRLFSFCCRRRIALFVDDKNVEGKKSLIKGAPSRRYPPSKCVDNITVSFLSVSHQALLDLFISDKFKFDSTLKAIGVSDEDRLCLNEQCEKQLYEKMINDETESVEV